MKILYCDLCKKEFGRTVNHAITIVEPHPFASNEFYFKGRDYSDLCSDCYNRIAKAQNDEVEKIKKKQDEKNNKN